MKQEIELNLNAEQLINQVDDVKAHIESLNEALEKTSRLLQQVTGQNEQYITKKQLKKVLKDYVRWE
jgi:ABC-type transporter Mla subunit MlaD